MEIHPPHISFSLAATLSAALLCSAQAQDVNEQGKTSKDSKPVSATVQKAGARGSDTAVKAIADPAETRYLNWEHTLTTRTSTSKHPIAQLKIYNNWTPSQHRLLVKYNILGLGVRDNLMSRRYGSLFSMPSFDPTRIIKKAAYHHGTLGVVERLNDDRFIAYSSEAGSYFTEPRRALMKRLRFDPYKKIAPELSKEDPLSLTPEQRKRLGREVRSAIRPLMKDVFRGYFRPISEARTFNINGESIAARGYRMTMMFNSGSEYEGEQWYRMNFEWWLAPGTEDDEVLQQYGLRYLADLKELHGPTSSMWMNETLPIMWEMMPQAMHQAVDTFMPRGIPMGFSSDPEFQIVGVPVYAAMTLLSPPEPEYARCPRCGEKHIEIPGKTTMHATRLEVQLNKRDSRVLGQQIFVAPPEYKKDSIQPTLKEWDEGMDAVQSLFDEDRRLSDASASVSRSPRMVSTLPNATQAVGGEHVVAPRPRHSWGAMREFLLAFKGAPGMMLK